MVLAVVVPSAGATHDPNDFWVNENQTVAISDIHGSGTAVWASSINPSVAYRRDAGPVWVPVPTGLAASQGASGISTKSGIHVLSSSDVLVCGQLGNVANGATFGVARWDGTTFNSMGDTLISCFDIWAVSGTDIWAVGRQSTPNTFDVSHWNGATWTGTDIIPGTSACVSVFAFGPLDVWAICAGNAWHYTGSWAQKGSVGSSGGSGGGNQGRMWGTSSTNLYYAPQLSEESLVRSTDLGVTWTPIDTGTMSTVNTVWGVGTTDFWVGGGDIDGLPVLLHSATATTFTVEESGSVEAIRAVFFSTATEGYYGTVPQGQTTGGSPRGVFKLQVVGATSPPTISLVEDHELDDFNVEVDSSCNGDPVSFRILIDLNSALTTIIDMDVTVANTLTGVWVASFDDSTMFSVGNKLWFFAAEFPPGPYVAHASADVNGLGGFVDTWDAAPFSVSLGTCIDSPFDPSGILDELDDLRNFILGQHNQTRSLTNTTHTHIDSHFNTTNALIVNQFMQTNGYVNTSRIQILDAINNINVDVDCGDNATNCTFAPQSIVDFPGLTDEQVGAFLLFFVVLILSFFQRWLFVAIACVIGILDVFVLGGIFGFEFTALLLVIAVMLQIYVDHRDAHREEAAQREAKQDGLSDGN